MMAQNDLVVAGIDVAKDKVDVCIRSLSLKSETAPKARGPANLVSVPRQRSQMPGSGTVEHAFAANDRRILRAGCVRHAACIAAPPLIGNSRRNSPISCASASPAKRPSSDAGSRA
jgi:hypothetical protein